MRFTYSFGVMDLQRFAYDPTAQPANYTGASGLSAEMKTYYDMNLLDNASPALIHEQFGEDKDIPKNHGKEIEFRRYAALAKADTPLTEGVTPDGKAMTVTTVTSTINQYGDFIAISDMLRLTALDDNVLQATKLLGEQAGLTMDTVVRNQMLLGTNVGYASSWSGTTETTHSTRYSLTADSQLTVLETKRVVRNLRRANAKPFPDGYYRAIIHPDVALDLMCDPEWVDSHKYAAPEELFKGEIGRVGGVRFAQSTEAKIFRGDDLCATSRTLTAGATTASKTVSVSETLVASALVGRYVIIGTTRTKVTANTTDALTVEDNITCSANTPVYPGEGGAAGIAVYACLFVAPGAYAKTKVTGGELETIVEPPHDPLHQRSTVGWKGTKTAKILNEDRIYRLEVGSSNSTVAVAN